MKKNLLVIASMLLVMVAMTGCKDGVESKIVGTYELILLPGQTFEFKSNGDLVNIVKPESIDCVIKSTSTWDVKSDSMFIQNDVNNISYEFGSSVSDEEKELFKSIMEGVVGEATPEKQAYKIVSVDDKEMQLEMDGTTFTYTRVKN